MIRMLLSCSCKKEEFHDIGFVNLFTRQTEDGQGIWCEGLIYFLYLSEALFESKGTLYIVCTGVNKKPKKFKTVWHGVWGILILSGRVKQASLKLSAGFSNTVCWSSKTCFVLQIA